MSIDQAAQHSAGCRQSTGEPAAAMSSAGTPRTEDKLGCDLKSLLKLKKKYDAPAEAELPATYRSNSDKERLWLWCANNMLRQIKETPLQPPCIFVLVTLSTEQPRMVCVGCRLSRCLTSVTTLTCGLSASPRTTSAASRNSSAPS